MLHYISLHPNNPSALERHTAKTLGVEPYLHPSAVIVDSHIGSWTEIGANSLIAESVIGDYTYTAGDNSIIYADIGKFCSIASHVRINPGNHPMERVTQHHMTYRRARIRLAAFMTSAGSGGAVPPSLRTTSDAACALSARRPSTPTFTPARASPGAIAPPKTPVPPVTTAVCPSRLKS